jgi:hypothetical protein
MPELLLTETASISCAHGGRCSAVGAAPRVTMGGAHALVQTTTLIVAGCSNPMPPNGTGLCVTSKFVTASLRVRIGGAAAVLATSMTVAAPTGTPTPVTAPGQSHVLGS